MSHDITTGKGNILSRGENVLNFINQIAFIRIDEASRQTVKCLKGRGGRRQYFIVRVTR
jgi:hypothetical protein